MNVVIEAYEPKKHYLRLAPLVVRYWREINREDLEEDIPVNVNGQWMGIKKVDYKLQNLLYEGIKVKVAILDSEIVGFIWYRDAFNCMVVGIDAFYVRQEVRFQKVGQMIINSFANQYNKGQFEIYAQFHEENMPMSMLNSFKRWEKVRSCNDRDLVLIKGTWDISTQGKDAENATVQSAIA